MTCIFGSLPYPHSTAHLLSLSFLLMLRKNGGKQTYFTLTIHETNQSMTISTERYQLKECSETARNRSVVGSFPGGCGAVRV
jgi:hypothetical protein